jgi:hypothetical protein
VSVLLRAVFEVSLDLEAETDEPGDEELLALAREREPHLDFGEVLDWWVEA